MLPLIPYPPGRKLEASAAAEVASNTEKVRKLRGDPIPYGTIAQLLHASSGRFVCFTRSRHGVSSSRLYVRLCEGSPEAWVGLHPGLQADKPGQPARYSAALHAVSPSMAAGLAFEEPTAPMDMAHPQVRAATHYI